MGRVSTETSGEQIACMFCDANLKHGAFYASGRGEHGCCQRCVAKVGNLIGDAVIDEFEGAASNAVLAEQIERVIDRVRAQAYRAAFLQIGRDHLFTTSPKAVASDSLTPV